MTPQCRTAWLRHRHEGSNTIKLKPTKTRARDEKDAEKEREGGGQRKSQNKTEAAAKETHFMARTDLIIKKKKPSHTTQCLLPNQEGTTIIVLRWKKRQIQQTSGSVKTGRC